MSERLIRLREWSSVDCAASLTGDQRGRLAALSDDWRAAHRLSAPPVAFEGPRGTRLRARQFVGVLQVDDVTVEIYPKLDQETFAREDAGENGAAPTLRHLLWILSVSGYDNLVETGAGGLDEAPETFVDLFALLLGKHLRAELGAGVPRRYERHEDDLRAVRGRLDLGRQASVNWDRYDRIACVFDEFTPDTPFNRILRCACREIRARVRGADARRLLDDCLALLDDVADIGVDQALREMACLPPWTRDRERFRRPFELAARLLRGFSHELTAGASNTFVFLLDMNKVFEAYAASAISARFSVPVKTQAQLGTLLDTPSGGIWQKPDFLWTDRDGVAWIGDAKYKHLASGQSDALTFARNESAPAGRVLSAGDIRQLTIYAELQRRKSAGPVRLALLYPFVGSGQLKADRATTWNDCELWLVPLYLARVENLADNLPVFLESVGETPVF